jgi:glycosyltransferase involved in cell wall biosynthesis
LPRTGGIELYLRDICRELVSRGHSPRIVTATPGPPHIDGVPIVRLDLPRLPRWDVAADPRASAQLRPQLAGADVVHALSLYSPLAHLATRAARALGIPCVLSSHSLLSPSGVWLCRTWQRWHRWGDWPDLLTGVSRLCVAELAIASGRDDVEVLPNGIDPDEFVSPPRPARPSATVVSVMRLHPRKEPLRLVEAFGQVCARLPPAHQPRLVLVGDGPERSRVSRAVSDRGIGNRVTLTGAVPRAQVAELLADADLFALPTRKEAFGLAALEALSAGLPVVGMRGTGLCDLVASGDNGLLADGIVGFAEALFRLCVDPSLRLRLAARARESVDRFAWPNVVARHLALYGRARACATQRLRTAAGC